jgi:hypothetical protein
MATSHHAESLHAFLQEVRERRGRSRTAPWSEWMRRAVGAPVAVGVSLALAGCGGDSSVACPWSRSEQRR